jgi:hypothetical protein
VKAGTSTSGSEYMSDLFPGVEVLEFDWLPAVRAGFLRRQRSLRSVCIKDARNWYYEPETEQPSPPRPIEQLTICAAPSVQILRDLCHIILPASLSITEQMDVSQAGGIVSINALRNVEELQLTVQSVDHVLAFLLANLACLKHLALHAKVIHEKAWHILCCRRFDILDVSNRRVQPAVCDNWLYYMFASHPGRRKLVHSFKLHGAQNIVFMDLLRHRGMDIEYIEPNT